MIIDGQVHGGVTQGDRRRALRGGRLRRGREPGDDDDDHVPRARRRRSFRRSRPTAPRREADNPLGVKGVGETGTIAAAPAVINAVVDALSHLGVTDVQMPATPERVWSAIQEVSVMIPAGFDYEVADSAEHAIALLGEREDAKLLAGGHSLLPAMKLRLARPAVLVDIGRIARAVVRPGRRRPPRDRSADPASGRAGDRAPPRALPDRRVHGGTHRRSAGPASRNDRRDARARRSCIRPARGDARARRRAGGSRAGRGADDPGGGASSPASSRPRSRPTRCSWRCGSRSGPSAGWSYVKMRRRAQDWATVGVAAIVERTNGSVGKASIGLTNMGATPLRAERCGGGARRRGVARRGCGAHRRTARTRPPTTRRARTSADTWRRCSGGERSRRRWRGSAFRSG